MIYLPENLFYNTTAPGIILFLNKAKPAALKNKLVLLNANREFEKGDPKNFIPETSIERIVEAYTSTRHHRSPRPVMSTDYPHIRVVSRDEIVKNDYNISPSRYIHTADGEEYRPIAEIVEELEVLDKETVITNQTLKEILKTLA